jgi:3',5'-cyclic AMP phosphodiesterase CpdA
LSSFHIAHLSDLHFSKISFGPSQFFSKRFIGNFNFLLRRRREFDYRLIKEILPLLLKQNINTVLISGDVSCTSLEAEFLQASNFVKTLKEHGIETLILPGNHDNYTKKAYRTKAFYKFFPAKELHEEQIMVKSLKNNWKMILLDTTLPTPLFCCHGKFDEKLAAKLEKTLAALSTDTNVIVANHFPIGHPHDRSLKGESLLLPLLKKHPQVKLYLHGHTHKRRFSDVETEGLPLIVDSGSASHKFVGSWNAITCEESSCTVSPFVWKKSHWAPAQEKTLTW